MFLSQNLCFSQVFLFKLPVEITIGKGIRRSYKYDQWNWPYTSPNTTFVIPPRFDTSIQTQRNSASDAAVGANDEASSGLDTYIQT